MEFEENEANNRSAEKDIELYNESCKIIRRLFTDIAKLKQQSNSEVC